MQPSKGKELKICLSTNGPYVEIDTPYIHVERAHIVRSRDTVIEYALP